jgi:endogenous inhibitor of DNA gyrase (YacG/DUF329 family)
MSLIGQYYEAHCFECHRAFMCPVGMHVFYCSEKCRLKHLERIIKYGKDMATKKEQSDRENGILHYEI